MSGSKQYVTYTRHAVAACDISRLPWLHAAAEKASAWPMSVLNA